MCILQKMADRQSTGNKVNLSQNQMGPTVSTPASVSAPASAPAFASASDSISSAFTSDPVSTLATASASIWLELCSASVATAAVFYSLIQLTPPTVNARSNSLLAPQNHMKPAWVTGACKPTSELLPFLSCAINWTGDATTCPRPAPFDGVGAKTDE